MELSDDVVPSITLASRTSFWPPKASVEHFDSSEGYDGFASSTPASSVTTSSHGSVESLRLTDTDESVDVVTRDESSCFGHMDGALEVARNHSGCIPPRNFGRVLPGVYRSAFPEPENFDFLKTLGLKTILTLVPEEYSTAHEVFLADNGILHARIPIQPNKDPFVVISQCDVARALNVVMDRSYHPMLIHCNKGKHRTGTVVGCLRKVLGWSMERIFEEYRRHAGQKARVLDERFIDMFDERSMLWFARHHGLVDAREPREGSPVPALGVSTRLRG